MKLNNKGYAITIIVFGILIVFIIVLSSLLVTMNNSVKLNKVVNEDVIENIQLSTDTSGSSLTERIEQLESNYNQLVTQLSNVKQETINEIYPVGSIYISTTDDSVEDVVERFGGEWVTYSEGRTLVGEGTGTDVNGNVSTFVANNTGGEYIHTLTIDQLPSHNHSIPALTGTTSKVGQKSSVWINGAPRVFDGGTTTLTSAPGMFLGVSSSGGTTYLTQSSGTASSNSVITFDGRHNHTVTTTASTTGNTGTGSSFSVQNPYITVYMYKRTK